MLASIGYSRKTIFRGEPFPGWVYHLIGNWHQTTTEGVGTNQIILYERSETLAGHNFAVSRLDARPVTVKWPSERP